MWLLMAAVVLLLLPTAAGAQSTVVIDPADHANIRVTRRLTDRSKRIYLEVPKSAAVRIQSGDAEAELARLRARVTELEQARICARMTCEVAQRLADQAGGEVCIERARP